MNNHYVQRQGTANVYPGDVLQAVTDLRFHVGGYLAHAQHHQTLLDEAAQAYLLQQAGVRTDRGIEIVAAVRRIAGDALIWTGRRLHGESAVEPAAG